MMLDDFLAMIPKEDKQRIDQQIDKLLMEQQRGKQTSIEWFASVTAQLGYVSMEILEQAMERHKEEIMDAFQHGKWDWHEHLQQGTLTKDPAWYYNETFKGVVVGGGEDNNKKQQPTFQDPYNLTDEEIDNLMIYSGTYKEGKDASEETLS